MRGESGLFRSYVRAGWSSNTFCSILGAFRCRCCKDSTWNIGFTSCSRLWRPTIARLPCSLVIPCLYFLWVAWTFRTIGIPCGVSGSLLYPNIRDVELQGAYYKWGPLLRDQPLSLSIGYIPWDHRPTHKELRDILSGSPMLCSLSISGALPCTGARVDLSLPQLSSFNLGFTSPLEVSVFVTGIDVPSLKKLELHYTTPTLPREALPVDSEAVLYAKTADAFNHLIEYLPLEQLLCLSIRSVRFSREESIVATTSQVDKGLVKDYELPAVLRFIQRLKVPYFPPSRQPRPRPPLIAGLPSIVLISERSRGYWVQSSRRPST